MHKDHRKGIDTRVALLTALRRRESERVGVSAGAPFIQAPADVQHLSIGPLNPADTSQPLPPPAKHRYKVPRAFRRLAAHIRSYLIEQLRHDLYLHVERSTATMIDRLVAENQETRGQLRRLSATLDELSRRSTATDANSLPRRSEGDLWQRGPRQRAPNSPTARAREGEAAAASQDTRDEIANGIETLLLDVTRAVDAVEAHNAGGTLPEETRAQIAALSDVIERLTTQQASIRLRLERTLGEAGYASAGSRPPVIHVAHLRFKKAQSE